MESPTHINPLENSREFRKKIMVLNNTDEFINRHKSIEEFQSVWDENDGNE
jgi:hypothetical protein